MYDRTKREYVTYDGMYGRSLDDVSVSSGFSCFFEYLSIQDISAINDMMIDLKLAYQKANVVLISASLLIVYEGSSIAGKEPLVKLIDFAHSRTFCSDIEKDEFIQEREGVLLGLENVTRFIKSLKIP